MKHNPVPELAVTTEKEFELVGIRMDGRPFARSENRKVSGAPEIIIVVCKDEIDQSAQDQQSGACETNCVDPGATYPKRFSEKQRRTRQRERDCYGRWRTQGKREDTKQDKRSPTKQCFAANTARRIKIGPWPL